MTKIKCQNEIFLLQQNGVDIPIVETESSMFQLFSHIGSIDQDCWTNLQKWTPCNELQDSYYSKK